jgi:hypothetical protein
MFGVSRWVWFCKGWILTDGETNFDVDKEEIETLVGGGVVLQQKAKTVISLSHVFSYPRQTELFHSVLASLMMWPGRVFSARHSSPVYLLVDLYPH